MKRHFKSIQILGEPITAAEPILAISNHFSWWDGFLVQYLNQKRFGKDFYFMMLEEQLRKRMFLNKCGGFSVGKQPRELLKSISHAAALLSDPNNLVLIFPQGKIETKYRYPFQFKRGIEEILKRAEKPVQVVFIASLVDYFSHSRPGLFIHYQGMDQGTQPGRRVIEQAYNSFFSSCVAKQKEA